MDELLHERLEELKKIGEQVEKLMGLCYEPLEMSEAIGRIRFDISVMIQRAEEAYRKF